MADVVMHRVSKAFGKVEAIRGVDLEIESGEFCVFVGPSGCGKSTLLRLIAGLEDISSGDLFIGGIRANPLPPAKRGVAMVFQSYALYPHMTVYENMAFGLRLARADRGEIKTRVTHAARILQLEPLLDRLPKALSGGQRQRVAIGRAIVREPKVFLFDEPLSNLDAALRVQMRIEIAKLHADLKATMVYVTHDQVEAMTMADKIVVLNDGRVEQIGAPLTLYHHPCNIFVAGFIGSPKMNFVDCRIARIEQTAVVVSLPGGSDVRVAVDTAGARAGDSAILGIRPEHCVQCADHEAGITGRVVVVERLGDAAFAYVDVHGARGNVLIVHLPADTRVQAGALLRLSFPQRDGHLFNADGIAFRRLADTEPRAGDTPAGDGSHDPLQPSQ